jgi:hypothetical protein
MRGEASPSPRNSSPGLINGNRGMNREYKSVSSPYSNVHTVDCSDASLTPQYSHRLPVIYPIIYAKEMTQSTTMLSDARRK